MIDRRLVHVKKNALAAAVDDIGIAGNSELGDPRDEIAVSVVDVETSVPLVVRMKGEAEQATLSYVVDDVVEDEKIAGSGVVPARWQDLDRAGLLENEYAVSAISRVCEEERLLKIVVRENLAQLSGLHVLCTSRVCCRHHEESRYECCNDSHPHRACRFQLIDTFSCFRALSRSASRMVMKSYASAALTSGSVSPAMARAKCSSSR